MEVIEFKNEFQIKTHFAKKHLMEYQKKKIKCICSVIEWSVNLFSGAYIKQPTYTGCIFLEKEDLIDKPFEVSRDNQTITFRKFVSAPKYIWKKNIGTFLFPI